MTLVDKLLKADVKKADEFESVKFASKRLAKILGVEKTDEKVPTVDVTLTEIGSRRINDIMAYQLRKNGEVDFSKTYDAKLMLCVEGITDPDLRNKDLQTYFGVDSAKALCEKLFGSEVNTISDKIASISGVDSDEDTEQEIKNL